jgi:hypothetical protein
MTPLVYNVALAVGLLLIGGGLALVSVAAALAVVGFLVIALTLFGAYLTAPRR